MIYYICKSWYTSDHQLLVSCNTLQQFRQRCRSRGHDGSDGFFMDLQSGQRFVLLEQQLGELTQTVLVEAAAATKTKKNPWDLFKKENLSMTPVQAACVWLNGSSSHSLSSSFSSSKAPRSTTLIWFSIRWLKRKERKINKEEIKSSNDGLNVSNTVRLHVVGIVMNLTCFIGPAHQTDLQMWHCDDVKSPFFVLHCPSLICCCFVVFFLFSGAK